MRQAGRSEQGRLQMVGCTLLFPRGVGWGGEGPKGVCLSQYPGVSMPFPRTRVWPAGGVHLTPPCVQLFQTTGQGAGNRVPNGSGQDGVGERGLGWLQEGMAVRDRVLLS